MMIRRGFVGALCQGSPLRAVLDPKMGGKSPTEII
jgi:hypothetical protein